ncbi:MAG: YjbH domain-containing protein, partial [Candidatus Kapabacteria bacterium]|nr:YjbH domain-containing protein [Candidatus Kapabacteria bacterium]MDW7997638.1 hypothetical protein [Bacteroidota bacterium]
MTLLCLLALHVTALSTPHTLVGGGTAVQTITTITIPAAGILPRGTLLARAGFFPEGTISAECFISPLPRFLVGLSYSGQNIIGSGNPQWQPFPGVSLRFRAIEETPWVPALVFGIHTQGWGSYDRQQQRFTVPAGGLFAAASKSYRWWLGDIAWHAVLSYPLELPSHQRRPNVAIGWEHSLARFGQLLVEYNTLWGDATQ